MPDITRRFCRDNSQLIQFASYEKCQIFWTWFNFSLKSHNPIFKISKYLDNRFLLRATGDPAARCPRPYPCFVSITRQNHRNKKPRLHLGWCRHHTWCTFLRPGWPRQILISVQATWPDLVQGDTFPLVRGHWHGGSIGAHLTPRCLGEKLSGLCCPCALRSPLSRTDHN